MTSSSKCRLTRNCPSLPLRAGTRSSFQLIADSRWLIVFCCCCSFLFFFCLFPVSLSLPFLSPSLSCVVASVLCNRAAQWPRHLLSLFLSLVFLVASLERSIDQTLPVPPNPLSFSFRSFPFLSFSAAAGEFWPEQRQAQKRQQRLMFVQWWCCTVRCCCYDHYRRVDGGASHHAPTRVRFIVNCKPLLHTHFMYSTGLSKFHFSLSLHRPLFPCERRFVLFNVH